MVIYLHFFDSMYGNGTCDDALLSVKMFMKYSNKFFFNSKISIFHMYKSIFYNINKRYRCCWFVKKGLKRICILNL